LLTPASYLRKRRCSLKSAARPAAARAGCAALLQRAILEEPAALVRDGGVIAARLRRRARRAARHPDQLRQLPARPGNPRKARTGIANLRVQFNRVHGFYIEVTQGQLDKVPDDYRRRQTLKNAERFITPELKAFEDKALSAQERALAREKWLFEQLLDALQDFIPRLSATGTGPGLAGRAVRAGRALAHAELVRAGVRARALHRHPAQGRHPVVEARLAETGNASFIANDTSLERRQRMQVITGPNMGGKSTYMRQVAIIVLLGQHRQLMCRRRVAGSGRSTRSTPASARPTTWPTRSRPS
jgi:DNA mismatch repair protein MutS